MERKSSPKFFVLFTACLLMVSMTVSVCSAQWWLSSSSTSSSTTSSSTTSTSTTSSSSTSSSSTSSSGSVVVDPGSTGSYTKCIYTPPSNTGYSAAQVWYPCSGTGPFPATTLTSGYTGKYTDIAYLADHLVTHGYIIFAMTPNNNYGTNPSWTTAHKSGIAQLKKENTRSGSAIKGKVDTARLQVMGHSKGGGGTLLASNSLGANIKTAQALTPYMDYSYSLSSTKAKTNCITGTADTIASPSAVVTMYNSLPNAIDRTLMYFQGLDHMVFTTDGNQPYKMRTTKYITAFMKYHLDGNSSYQTYLYGAKHTEDMNAGWFYAYSHNANF